MTANIKLQVTEQQLAIFCNVSINVIVFTTSLLHHNSIGTLVNKYFITTNQIRLKLRHIG